MKYTGQLFAVLFCICLATRAHTQLTGPAGINDHIKLWLDASNVNNTSPATNPANATPVPLWRDVSGNHNDASILGIGIPPVLSSSQINGNDVVHFTRFTQNAGTGYVVPLLDIRSSSSPVITVFTVYKQGPTVNSANEIQGIWGNDDGDWDRFFLSRMGSMAGGVSVGAPVNYVPISNSGAVGEIRLLAAVYDHGVSSGSTVYFNAQPVGVVSENTDPLLAQPDFRIGFDGDDNFFNGDIAEMVVYDRKLNNCEIRAINRYFSLKYGIDLSSVDITPWPTVSFCSQHTPFTTLTANSSLPAVTYQWTKDGLPIPGATGSTYQAIQTGSYSVIATSSGCEDVAEPTTVIAYDNAHTTLNEAICQGTSHTLPDGIVVSTAGTYTSILNTIHGCDSIITTHLRVNPVYAITQSHTMCPGSSYTLPDGTAVTTAGIYISHLNTIYGCDSTITTQVSLYPTYSITQTHSICPGTTYTLPNGTVVSSAGTYVSHLHTIHGCDSIITTQLSLYPAYSITQDHSMCPGSAYTLPDGTVVTNAGTYVSHLSTIHGCDSIINTRLSLYPAYSITQDHSMCPGSAYTLPDGTVVTNAGTYVSHLSTIYGCDSAITTQLALYPAYTQTRQQTMCPGSVFTLPDGTQATSPGIYTSHFQTIHGCDSVIITQLTLNPPVTGELEQTGTIFTCEGIPATLRVKNTNAISFQWYKNGQTINGATSQAFTTNLAGMYSVLLETAEGCRKLLPETITVTNYTNSSIIIKSAKTCVNIPIGFHAVEIPSSQDYFYSWDFGDGSPIYTGADQVHMFTRAGTYLVRLTATHNHCPGLSRQVDRHLTIVEPKPGLKTKLYVSTGIPEQLKTRDLGVAVLWTPTTSLNNPALATPVFISATDGTFKYKVEHSFQTGCVTTDSVTLICGTDGIYVPGGFTPDYDGLNDIIRPIIFGKYELVQFSIYNRGGQQLFSTSQKGIGWDGKYKQEMQPAAAYVWMVQVKNNAGTLLTKKGTFVLLR